MSQRLKDEGDQYTYFGLWSLKDKEKLSLLLQDRQIQFYFAESYEDEKIARAWFAWDINALEPNKTYHLWIRDQHYNRVGDLIKVNFPERDYI